MIIGQDEIRARMLAIMRKAVEAQNDWLEDVLAGLLINGVRSEEVECQYFPNEQRYVVLVRGVPKYEHKVNWLS